MATFALNRKTRIKNRKGKACDVIKIRNQNFMSAIKIKIWPIGKIQTSVTEAIEKNFHLS